MINLLACADPRAFLSEALKLQYQKKGRVNLADFSRKAGFSSRSFLTEYLSGKKKLSKESLRQIKTALVLPKPYMQLFALLVWQDQPELATQSAAEVEATLEKHKTNLKQQETTKSLVTDTRRIVRKKDLFRLYAALGTEADGASLSEIITRTGMKLSEIQEGLQTLLEENVVVYENQRFYARANQVDFLGFSDKDALSTLLKDVCEDFKSQATSITAEDRNFVFYSAFSVQSQQLPLFKKKLREALYSVLDEFQCDGGDKVHQVFLCSKN